jgi:hypothetical protein
MPVGEASSGCRGRGLSARDDLDLILLGLRDDITDEMSAKPV